MSTIRDQHDLKLERLRYVQSMLGELRILAEAEDCDLLTYLIEMAYVEASEVVRGERPSQTLPGQQGNAVA